MSKILVLFPQFMTYVLEKAKELSSTPQIWSQIQALRSGKYPRLRSQVLELVPRSQKMSQIQVLGLRISSQVLENILDFCPISQVYVLGTGEGPRIRFYVLDLGPTFRQVLGPRIRSQVLEYVLDLGSSCLRLWSQFLSLCPMYQKRSKN